MKLISNGLTGTQWIERLEKKGFKVSDYAKQLLNSPDFKPSKKGTKYEIALVKISDIGSKDYYTTKEIQEYFSGKGYEVPNAEIGCLLREKLSDEDIEKLGLWYVTVMHEPIKDSDGDPDLLGVDRHAGGRWLVAYGGNPDVRWSRGDGFVFVVSQVSTKSSKSKSLPSDTQSFPDFIMVGDVKYFKQ